MCSTLYLDYFTEKIDFMAFIYFVCYWGLLILLLIIISLIDYTTMNLSIELLVDF